MGDGMSDLVQRLRNNAEAIGMSYGTAQEAADEIERLQEAIRQWSTLAMRARPSIASKAWLSDCGTVLANPVYGLTFEQPKAET